MVGDSDIARAFYAGRYAELLDQTQDRGADVGADDIAFVVGALTFVDRVDEARAIVDGWTARTGVDGDPRTRAACRFFVGLAGARMVGGFTRRLLELAAGRPGGALFVDAAIEVARLARQVARMPRARVDAVRPGDAPGFWALDSTGWVDLPNSCFTYGAGGRALLETRAVRPARRNANSGWRGRCATICCGARRRPAPRPKAAATAIPAPAIPPRESEAVERPGAGRYNRVAPIVPSPRRP